MDHSPQPEGYAERPVVAQVAHPPAPMPRRPRGRSLRRLLLVLGLLGCGGLLLLIMLSLAISGLTGFASLDGQRRVRETYFSHERRSDNKIVIISVKGTIFDAENGFAKHQIDRAAVDPDVKAIVLRVNSPGGSVTGSDYIYHHLRKLAEKRKRSDQAEIPIVVSMGGLAASGGYYVSMAVDDTPDSIYAEPTTWTGSIGVIIPHYDFSELLAKHGVRQDSITSDEFKGMGSFTKKMTDEERAILDELVQQSFSRFKEIIKNGRPQFRDDPEALDKLATGQIFTALQAKESGLIDEIGFIEDAVDRAVELAGVRKNDVTVVKYEREPSLANLLMGGQAKSQPLDLAKILELTAPRAYFLCTWLPGLSRGPEP